MKLRQPVLNSRPNEVVLFSSLPIKMDEKNTELTENMPIVFFDGYCNLCNHSVQFILKHESGEQLSFASLQSELGVNVSKKLGQSIHSPTSLIFWDGHQFNTESEAALKIAPFLKRPYSWFSIFKRVPSRIRDSVYRFISKNRFSIFGKRSRCYMPTPSLQHRFIT